MTCCRSVTTITKDSSPDLSTIQKIDSIISEQYYIPKTTFHYNKWNDPWALVYSKTMELPSWTYCQYWLECPSAWNNSLKGSYKSAQILKKLKKIHPPYTQRILISSQSPLRKLYLLFLPPPDPRLTIPKRNRTCLGKKYRHTGKLYMLQILVSHTTRIYTI